jgi:DnaB-like helicase C terminal domain
VTICGHVIGAGGLSNDCFDEISAEFITKKMANASHGTVAVIDYLQLLDQKREKPNLIDRVRTLKSFARDKELIFIFLSQMELGGDDIGEYFDLSAPFFAALMESGDDLLIRATDARFYLERAKPSSGG